MMKTYFVYDKETRYILSGYECLSDDHADGYNVFNRPYCYPDCHSKDEKCSLDFLYKFAKRNGLDNLKYDNMIVAVTNYPNDVKCHFVDNPKYFNSKNAVRGWWKLDCNVQSV